MSIIKQQLPVCTNKLKYIEFIEVYISLKSLTDDDIKTKFADWNLKYINTPMKGATPTVDNIPITNKLTLADFIVAKQTILNSFLTSETNFNEKNTKIAQVLLSDNSKNLLNLEMKINNKLIRMNKKSGYQTALNILVTLPLILIVGMLFKFVMSLIQSTGNSKFSIFNWTSAKEVVTHLTTLQTKSDPILLKSVIKKITNNELNRSIRASIVSVLCVGGMTGWYLFKGGGVFDNMIYIQMAFGNILGFVLDQVYAKHEGRLLFSFHDQNKNIVYNTKDKEYAISGIGNESFYNNLKNKNNFLKMSKWNYLPHKMLSKQFLKFIITVIIDMCASSYLTNLVTTWAKEHNMFPNCYTNKLCDKPSNTENENDDENDPKLYPFGLTGTIGFKKKTIDYWFKLAINTIVGLITFYLYVNKTRICWAYVPDPTFVMSFIIVIFSIVAVFMYLNQDTVSNPSLYQTLQGKRYLGIALFILLLLVEYWSLWNTQINSLIGHGTDKLSPIHIGLFLLCIGFMFSPVIYAHMTIKKETVVQKCHDDIYKKMRQSQSVITHFHDVDDIKDIDIEDIDKN